MDVIVKTKTIIGEVAKNLTKTLRPAKEGKPEKPRKKRPKAK